MSNAVEKLTADEIERISLKARRAILELSVAVTEGRIADDDLPDVEQIFWSLHACADSSRIRAERRMKAVRPKLEAAE